MIQWLAYYTTLYCDCFCKINAHVNKLYKPAALVLLCDQGCKSCLHNCKSESNLLSQGSSWSALHMHSPGLCFAYISDLPFTACSVSYTKYRLSWRSQLNRPDQCKPSIVHCLHFWFAIHSFIACIRQSIDSRVAANLINTIKASIFLYSY